MSLWIVWDQTVAALRPACARPRTFLWGRVVRAAMTLRTDLAGVSRLVRSHWRRPRCSHRRLSSFHAPALDLPKRIRTWSALGARVCARRRVRVGDRVLPLADGLTAPKAGQKMPAGKSLPQAAAGNPKPAFLLGHSCPAVAVLGPAVGGGLAVPLAGRIHEGIVCSHRWRRPLLGKLVGLRFDLGLETSFDLMADACSASRTVALPLLAQGPHLVRRLRARATADEPAAPSGTRPRGRPRCSGRKIKRRDLFCGGEGFVAAPRPVDGEQGIELRSRGLDWLWRPLGRWVRWVLVDPPTRGRLILLCTDLPLDALAILRRCGWRFNIEGSVKQALHPVGPYASPCWMKDRIPRRRGEGPPSLHRHSDR